MATPSIRENGFGFIPDQGRITKEKDGTISEAAIGRIYTQLRLITEILNGGLELRSGGALGRVGNFNAQLLEATTPSSANQKFTMPHSLDRQPSNYMVAFQNKAGSVYAMEFASWTKSSVFFASDATDMLINVIVF